MVGNPSIVVLNGVPRSGKSSIARALQASSEEPWMNLGVDAFAHITPERFRPGIGLRPGGGRPDLEAHLPMLFDALYASVIALHRCGLLRCVQTQSKRFHPVYSPSFRKLEGLIATTSTSGAVLKYF